MIGKEALGACDNLVLISDKPQAVKEVFQHAFAQGEFEMEAIVGISEAQKEMDSMFRWNV